MKTTTCALCGRNFSIDDGTVCGQHLLCPYCNGKFSYLLDSPEFSTERLSYAIAECRKREEDRLYYDAAPAGARLYIGLVFYGKVFGDNLNRDLYLAEMAAIESELNPRDWKYLLENEDDPELIAYFKEKLPEVSAQTTPTHSPIKIYKPPVLGVIRSPAPEPSPVLEPVVKDQPKQPKKMPRSGRQPSYFVLIAGVIGVLIVGTILCFSIISGSGDERPHRESSVSPSTDTNQSEKKDLLDLVNKKQSELNERCKQIEKSIGEIRADKNRFMVELNRAIESGNLKAAELQAKGVVRLNGAETAMSVLRAPFFNAFAIRYCGDNPFAKAEECRVKVQQILESSKELTPSGLDSINQVAIAYQESAVGEVRRAINEKYRAMTELRKALIEANNNLLREQTEIHHLDAKQIGEKRAKLEKTFQTGAFTADCVLADVEEQLNAQVPTDDVFSLAGKMQNEVAQSVSTAANAVMETKEAPQVAEKEPKKNPSNSQQEEKEPSEFDSEDQADNTAVETKAEKKPRDAVAQPKKSKGRRQKCKSTIKCMNFAEPGHSFCSEHECHAYGCKQHVRILMSPNWVHGGLGSMVTLSTAEKSRIKRKQIGKFCMKHCCNRVCPEIKNYTESWNEYLFWDNDKTEKFFFCENERLAKSRFCSEHACPISTCSSYREESWKLDDGTDRSNASIIVDSGHYWWHHLRNWMLIVGPMCRAHSNVDPETVPERDKRTQSDLLREREESRTQN